MLALCIGICVAVLDQASKYWLSHSLTLWDVSVVIPGLLNLTHVRNTGAVWGLFQYRNDWLVLLSFVVLGLMVAFYRWLVLDTRVGRWAVGLLLGGIVGNLIDRIKLGWVTDFLDFHWSGYHWPSFNVADAAICAGAFLYVLSSLTLSRYGNGKP